MPGCERSKCLQGGDEGQHLDGVELNLLRGRDGLGLGLLQRTVALPLDFAVHVAHQLRQQHVQLLLVSRPAVDLDKLVRRALVWLTELSMTRVCLAQWRCADVAVVLTCPSLSLRARRTLL